MAHEEPAEHLAMPFGGLGDPRHGGIQPSLYLPPSLLDGFGTLEDPGVGHQAQESEHGRPREPHGQSALQTIVQP
jgi:hypothetical protein